MSSEKTSEIKKILAAPHAKAELITMFISDPIPALKNTMGLPRVVLLGGEAAGKSTMHSLMTYMWEVEANNSSPEPATLPPWDKSCIDHDAPVESKLYLDADGKPITEMMIWDEKYQDNCSGLALIDTQTSDGLAALTQFDYVNGESKMYYQPDPIYPDLPRHHVLMINLDVLGEDNPCYPTAMYVMHAIVNEELYQGVPLTVVWHGHDAAQKSLDEGTFKLNDLFEADFLVEGNAESLASIKKSYTQTILNKIKIRQEELVALGSSEEDAKKKVLNWDEVKQFDINDLFETDKSLPIVKNIFEHLISTSYKPHVGDFLQLFHAADMLRLLMRPKAGSKEAKKEELNLYRIDCLLEDLFDDPRDYDELFERLNDAIPIKFTYPRTAGTPSIIVLGPGHSGKTTLCRLIGKMSQKNGFVSTTGDWIKDSIAESDLSWTDMIEIIINEFIYLLPTGQLPKFNLKKTVKNGTAEAENPENDQQDVGAQFDPEDDENIALTNALFMSPEILSMSSKNVASYTCLSEWKESKFTDMDELLKFQESLLDLWSFEPFKKWLQFASSKLRNPLGSTILNAIPLLPSLKDKSFRVTELKQTFLDVQGAVGVEVTPVFAPYDPERPLDISDKSSLIDRSVCINIVDIPSEWNVDMGNDDCTEERMQYFESDKLNREAKRSIVLLLNLDVFATAGPGHKNIIESNLDAMRAIASDSLFDVPLTVVWTGASALNKRLEVNPIVIEQSITNLFKDFNIADPNQLPKNAEGLKKAFQHVLSFPLAVREEDLDQVQQVDIDQLLDLDVSLPIIDDLYKRIVEGELLSRPDRRGRAHVMTQIMLGRRYNENNDSDSDF